MLALDFREIAADELSRLNHNYSAVKIIKSRIAEYEEKLSGCGKGTTDGAAPMRGGGNKTEMRWLNMISNIEDEKKRLRDVGRSIKRCETALSAIAPEEKSILQKVYIEGRDVKDVAVSEHLSRSSAYRLRDRALINFTRAYFGTVIT